MDPKQQARSHEMLKMFAWCGHKLTTLCVQDFDKYAKTWQGEHCMQCHIKVLIIIYFLYIHLVHDKVEIRCKSGRV